jgi:type IV pilus assembly protein PilF
MKQYVLALACALGMVVPAAVTWASSTPGDRQSIERAAAINTQLGLEYMKQGNLEAARDKIEKALKQDPHTAETQMAAGFLYDRLGDDRKAISHYDQAGKLGKDNPDIVNNVAVYLCRKGDRKRGEEYFLKAANNALYKTPDVAYTNAGRCARADGRPKDAEQYFRKALTFRADQPDSLLQLAELTHESGNNMQARAFLQRYFAVAPATAATLLLGNRIERALGDNAHAAEYANRLTSEFSSSLEAGLLLGEQSGKP